MLSCGAMISDEAIDDQVVAERDSERRAVMLMITLNAFTTPLMLSASNVALPAIALHFSLSAVTLSWVPMAYLMASAMSILVFGRMADLYGRKRLFLLGTVAVILSSTFTALALNTPMLLLGRFLQGVSAAMLYATQMAIVSSVFPVAQRGRAIGLVVATVYVGLAAGPLIGGVVTDLLGWRANFLLHIPLACAVLYLGLTRVKQEWRGSREPLDVLGAALFSLTIVVLCLGITNFPGMAGAAMLLLFLLFLLGFVRHASAHPHPIWDIRLFFTNAIFTRSCGASLIMYTATYANVVLMSLYLQQVKLLSATQAGLVLITQPVVMAILSPVAGRLSDRLEPRVLASAGMTVTVFGLWLLSSLSAASELKTAILALSLTGIGFSLFSSPNTNAIMSAVGKKDYGSAAGAVATTRILGQLSSIILVAFAMSVVIGDRLVASSTAAELERSIQLCFSIAAVLCLPGIALSVSRGKMHPH